MNKNTSNKVEEIVRCCHCGELMVERGRAPKYQSGKQDQDKSKTKQVIKRPTHAHLMIQVLMPPGKSPNRRVKVRSLKGGDIGEG